MMRKIEGGIADWRRSCTLSPTSQPWSRRRYRRIYFKALFEAVVIVLVVSFISLGVQRRHSWSLVSIPLVLAITFLFTWLIPVYRCSASHSAP